MLIMGLRNQGVFESQFWASSLELRAKLFFRLVKIVLLQAHDEDFYPKEPLDNLELTERQDISLPYL